jgi:hypothetical protein
MVNTIPKPNLKKIGIRMSRISDGLDFGSPLYYFSFQQLFVRLLEHRCPVCDKHELKGKEKNDKDKENSDYPEDGSKPKPAPGRNKFLNFRQLDKHMRVEHDLYYCDLCTGHLKVTLLLLKN